MFDAFIDLVVASETLSNSIRRLRSSYACSWNDCVHDSYLVYLQDCEGLEREISSLVAEINSTCKTLEGKNFLDTIGQVERHLIETGTA